MESSNDLRETMLDFYDRVSANDVASFDRLASAHPATLVIGTAPGEGVTERERLRFRFEAEGFGIEAGPSPTGYESADLGWFVDEPTYRSPDGTAIRTRLTAILRREDGA